jgi:hypothetical protein
MKFGLARWAARFAFNLLLGIGLATCGCQSAPNGPNAGNVPLQEGWDQRGNPASGARDNDSRAADKNAAHTRYDLEADEQRGGHSIRKHVGRTDDELRERLERERDISASSTWTDLSTAEETVGDALRADRDKIARWQEQGERRRNLALHYDSGRVIGRSISHGSSEVQQCTRAVIVLKADGAGFLVLTTYPESR